MRNFYQVILSVIMTVVLATPKSAEAQQIKADVGYMAYVGSLDNYLRFGALVVVDITDDVTTDAVFNNNVG